MYILKGKDCCGVELISLGLLTQLYFNKDYSGLFFIAGTKIYNRGWNKSRNNHLHLGLRRSRFHDDEWAWVWATSFGSVPLEELMGTNPTLHMQFKSQCLVNSVTWISEEGLTEEEREPRLYFKLSTRPARKQITSVLSALLRCRKVSVMQSSYSLFKEELPQFKYVLSNSRILNTTLGFLLF